MASTPRDATAAAAPPSESHAARGELPPSAALGAWIAQIVAGRRLAVLGDTSTGLAEQLAAATGRRVHAYDPDHTRAAASMARVRGGRGEVSFAALDEALDVREGAFDAIVIADVALVGDAADMVRRARDLLSARGVMAVASPNPKSALSVGRAGPGYYELYELMSEHFEHVRMLGQAPFVGYTVADFSAEGEPAITIDTELMDGVEEPSWFVALASTAPLEIDPYTLVQLPLGRIRQQLVGRGHQAPNDEERAEAKRQSALAHAELDKLRQREREAQRLADERKASATALATRLAELQAQLDDRRRTQAARESDAASKDDTARARIGEIERELASTREALAKEKNRRRRELVSIEEAHQQELDKMLERIGELEGEDDTPTVRAAGEPRELRALQFQVDELKKALATVRNERDNAGAKLKELDALKERLSALQKKSDGNSHARLDQDDDNARHAEEVSAFEQRLKERGGVIENLERKLRESERLGVELVRDLEQAKRADDDLEGSSSPASDPSTVQELAGLRQKCARYEADLQAAHWKIASLSARSAQPSESEDVQTLEAALRAAREELAQLRKEPQRAPAIETVE